MQMNKNTVNLSEETNVNIVQRDLWHWSVYIRLSRHHVVVSFIPTSFHPVNSCPFIFKSYFNVTRVFLD